MAALPAHGSVTAPIVSAHAPYSGCVRTDGCDVVIFLHSDATSDAYVGTPSTSFFGYGLGGWDTASEVRLIM